jgi:hypothetical protein
MLMEVWSTAQLRMRRRPGRRVVVAEYPAWRIFPARRASTERPDRLTALKHIQFARM